MRGSKTNNVVRGHVFGHVYSMKRNVGMLFTSTQDFQDLHEYFIAMVRDGNAIKIYPSATEMNFRFRMYYVLTDYIPIVIGRVFDGDSDAYSIRQLRSALADIFGRSCDICRTVDSLMKKYKSDIKELTNIRDNSRAHSPDPSKKRGKSDGKVNREDRIENARNALADELLRLHVVEIAEELNILMPRIDDILIKN